VTRQPASNKERGLLINFIDIIMILRTEFMQNGLWKTHVAKTPTRSRNQKI